MVIQRQSDKAVDHGTFKRAKGGDVDAISCLYRHFRDCVFWYIFNHVKDRHLAEDLTSDVFEKMVGNIRKIRANNEVVFRSWLLKVAHTTVAQHYLDHEKMPTCVPLEETLELPCVTEKISAVKEAFEAITEEQKQVLDGTVIIGYSAEEVGMMMGKKANTVRGLQFRGLNAMRSILIALIILAFLVITIKVIQLSSPSSSHLIKLLDKHVVLPHQNKSPEIYPTHHQDKVPTSTVVPIIQPIIPKMNTPVAIPATPTSTPVVTPIACVANINKICL